MGVFMFVNGCLLLLIMDAGLATWSQSDIKKELDREEACEIVESYHPSGEDCDDR